MIAKRVTQVAVATRYWRSQQLAGATACCHSRTSRFAHRVMAAVILRCQGAQHSEHPFLWQPIWALALRAVCCVRLRHVTAQQPIAGAAACNPLPHRTLTRTVSGVLLLMKQLAIRLSWQTTPTKSLVIAKGMTIRVSPHLNPLPLAGEEAIVLSPAYGGKLERGLAFLASSLADTLLRSRRLWEARHGRHSRTGGSRPPCYAAYPAKPSARPCGI